VSGRIALRFDIDTHKCVISGVPALLKLARQLDVSFTFFACPGRAVSRRKFLMSKRSIRTQRDERPVQLSSFSKLGWRDWLKVAIQNPSIISQSEIIAQIEEEGHELGLHGGKNHQEWAQEAADWSGDRVREEVLWGMKMLRGLNQASRLRGFASPGWTHPDGLAVILRELGFLYCADTHGTESTAKVQFEYLCGLVGIRTNLVGEPGGVGYFENRSAMAKASGGIAPVEFGLREQAGRDLVVYDHPFFAGCGGLDMVEAFIREGKESGFEFVTISSLVDV